MFFFLNFNLKVVRTNSFKLKSSTRLPYTSLGRNLGLSLLGKWRTTTKRKTNLGKIKNPKSFLEITVSQPKKHNYSIKTINILDTPFSKVVHFSYNAFSIGIVNNVIVRQGSKMNIKYAFLLKKKKEKLKTRSTKIMKHLVEFKTLADIYLFIKKTRFPNVFTKTAPEV